MQRLTGEVGGEEAGLGKVRQKGAEWGRGIEYTHSMAWRGGLGPDAPLSRISGTQVGCALPFLGLNVVLLF